MYMCAVRLIFAQVRCICTRFDLCLYGLIDICVIVIYMYVVRVSFFLLF